MIPNSREPYLKEGVVPSVKLNDLLTPEIKSARQSRNNNKNINKKQSMNEIFEEHTEIIPRDN